MAILAEATAQTKPDDITVTSWLVIIAARRRNDAERPCPGVA
ncbi:hypothetical protein [Streptomyces longisporoflavus]|nr:hypothetical protein [Streptomyces longisporoflavus]